MLRSRCGGVAKCFCRGQVRDGSSSFPGVADEAPPGRVDVARPAFPARPLRMAASSAAAHSAAFSVIAKLYLTGTGLP